MLDNEIFKKTYDYIVVGGGTAGSVVATRLSDNEQKSVLLIEAGVDSDANEVNSPLRDASQLVLDGYNWDYQANLGNNDRFLEICNDKASESEKSVAEKLFGYKAGKVLGGSSAVNGAVALRGFPSDFELWAEMGCTNWGWEQVKYWFSRIETDLDFRHSDKHGDKGPLRLRRPSSEELHPLDAVFSDVCQDMGIPYSEDLNSVEGLGVGLVPSNAGQDAERLDVYRSYIEPVLARKNLTVVTNALVDRVHFVDKKAQSVFFQKDGEIINIKSNHIVLCAGAIGTAAILQRSGIGDANHLSTLGIPVIADLPAVGNNLQDHSAVVLWTTPKEGIKVSPQPWRQVAARVSSGYDHEVDVQIGLLNNVSSKTVPRFATQGDSVLTGASVMLMRPEARGRVFITSRSPEVSPTIDYPIKSVDADIKRIIGGVRKIWEVLRSDRMIPWIKEIPIWSDTMINNDVIMLNAMKNLVNPGWHASGTVCMGASDDPGTAAQENGNIHGLEGITVADTSLFPQIPSMPTNLTTAMVAERVAYFLSGGDAGECR